MPRDVSSDLNLAHSTSSNYIFEGSIADVRIYDRALTQDEITTLYNGLQYKDFTATETITDNSINTFAVSSIYGNATTTDGTITLAVPYGSIDTTFSKSNWFSSEETFTISEGTDTYIFADMYNTLYNITANNIYDNSSINTFNVSINGDLFQTTNGTINIPLVDTNTYETILTAEDFFSQTESVSTFENFEFDTYQSILTFYARDIVTNDRVYDPTFTTTLQTTNETFYLNSGTYTINFSKTGWYNDSKDYTTYALGDTFENYLIFDTILNITALSIEGETPVQNFNINFSGVDYSTTNGEIIFNTTLSSVNATISGSNVATQSQVIDLSKGYNNYTFDVYESNSIGINIYNQVNNTLMNTTNITLTFISSEGQFSNTTSTGTFYTYNLTEGDYQIEFSATGFEKSGYFISVSNFSTQSLKAYMLPIGSEQTIFAFKDINTEAVIEGVDLSVEQIIDDEWVLINILTSDISGRVVLNYEEDFKYRFTTSQESYTDKLFTLDPIIFTSYNIWLNKEVTEKEDQDYSGININIFPSEYYNDQNNTIQIYFISPEGQFQTYGFNATYKTTTISASGTNAIGEVLSDVLLIENATLGDKVTLNYNYRLSDGVLKTYTLVYTIGGSDAEGTHSQNKDEHYGLGLLERTLISVIIVIGIAGASFFFGSLLSAGFMAMLVFGYLTYIGFLSGWITIPSMILIFIVTSWEATK